MKQFILAIDQGTTSTRAVLFDQQGVSVAKAQKEFPQYFPENGWVEHDPENIWRTVIQVCQDVILKINGDANHIAAMGITNQRETTVLWRKDNGKIIYPAIVWQDRRTADFCAQLRKHSPEIEKEIHKKTGLLLDPYFSATKIAWVLDHVEGARELAEKGLLAFGTMDCFLLWRFTQGRRHVTDVTNASRTLLYNIGTLSWDVSLLKLFDIPESVLPEVFDNTADFGETHPKWFGCAIPITGMAGDQHAAAFGQACFEKGSVKSTYGTGCFLMVNTGETMLHSKHRLLTTILSRVQNKTTYAMEGSIFVAGATVKWLRDQLGFIRQARETESIAGSIESNHGVYLVPAFTGLGSPYWRPDVRASLVGMTRDTGKREIVRAALEAVAYQTHDLLNAMRTDGVTITQPMRVDGGMVENNWLLQFLADILNITVERPKMIETTVRGVAYLAGLHVGFYTSLEQLKILRQLDRSFEPSMAEAARKVLCEGWRHAVNQTCLEK